MVEIEKSALKIADSKRRFHGFEDLSCVRAKTQCQIRYNQK